MGTYLSMTLSVMIFDMRPLGRLPERRNIPVQIPQPLMDIRIPRSYIPDVRLEVLDVDDIKSHNRSVESNVCFCDFVAKVEGS